MQGRESSRSTPARPHKYRIEPVTRRVPNFEHENTPLGAPLDTRKFRRVSHYCYPWRSCPFLEQTKYTFRFIV